MLRTLDGNRFLPIWIGHPEAAAILMKLQGTPTARPMTHDLVTSMLEKLERDRVQGRGHRAPREHASTHSSPCRWTRAEVEIDSRPSDALALAVRTEAPIFVADAVLDDSAIEFGQEPDDAGEVIDEFKKFLESVNPDDFAG